MPLRTFTSRQGGGAVGGELPDMVWREDAELADTIGPRPRLGGRGARLTDVLQRVQVRGFDSADLADAWRASLDRHANADNAALDDVLRRALIDGIAYGASGTPDADPGGDSWVDQNNPTGTHGGEPSGLVKGNVLSTERRALMEFDLTRFGNLSARVGGTQSFRFRASHDAAVGANNLRVRFSSLATRPFTESSVNWNNQPAEGTLQKSVAVAVASGGAQVYTVTFSDAEIAGLLGSWAYVRMLSEATLATTVFTVECREFSPWLLNLDLKR